MPHIMQQGSVRDDVKRLQRVLARIGVTSPFGPISGQFDAALATAVRGFQSDNGLTPDGIVGPATWAKLPSYREASPTLRLGDTGPVVAWLQQTLNGSNIALQFPPYTGAIDGIFGPPVQTAVHALQTWAGIPADGVVGDQTWFIWMTPATAQHLTLEAACHLLDGLY